jgi:hypothetical protein
MIKFEKDFEGSEIISRHLPGGTEDNHEEPLSA